MFPALYHAHHSLYTEDIPFWMALASQCTGTTLELGCGTGRITLALADTGHPVVGLDNDAKMLSFLRGKMTCTQETRVQLIQADMTAFRLEEQFDLIILPCNTYSTFSLPDQEAILGCVHRHLRPGGIFAVSMPNPILLSKLPAQGESEIEDVFEHPVDGEPVQVSSAWVQSGSSFTVDWNYDHLRATGKVERLCIKVRHLLTEPSEHRKQFHLSGLETIHAYGDFDSSKYGQESPYLILIASKTKC